MSDNVSVRGRGSLVVAPQLDDHEVGIGNQYTLDYQGKNVRCTVSGSYNTNGTGGVSGGLYYNNGDVTFGGEASYYRALNYDYQQYRNNPYNSNGSAQIIIIKRLGRR